VFLVLLSLLLYDQSFTNVHVTKGKGSCFLS